MIGLLFFGIGFVELLSRHEERQDSINQALLLAVFQSLFGAAV